MGTVTALVMPRLSPIEAHRYGIATNDSVDIIK